MPKTWWAMVVGALVIATYAGLTVVLGDRMFPAELADSFRSRPWGIFPHALFGGTALALGVFQFHRGLLQRHRGRHRLLGKIYLIGCLGTGVAGSYMSFFSYGGLITHLGFAVLAVGTLTTSLIAYLVIRRGEVVRHREWMIRSYALIFAAVTLRIELPILVVIFGGPVAGFLPAYQVIAWLCWVPNAAVGEILIRRSRRPPLVRAVEGLRLG